MIPAQHDKGRSGSSPDRQGLVKPGYDPPKELGSEKGERDDEDSPRSEVTRSESQYGDFGSFRSGLGRLPRPKDCVYFTVIKSLILPNSTSLMPLTFITSSMVLNGRPSMIAWALKGPIPGRTSSSSFEAVLMLTFSPALGFGVSFVTA